MLSTVLLRVSLVSLLAIPAVQFGWLPVGSPFSQSQASSVAGARLADDTAADDAEHALDAFVGTWEMYDQGLRRITVNPDGTATMEVKIESIGKWLYGSRFTLDLEWSQTDNILSYSIVGGSPARSLDRVLGNFGRDYQYRVVRQTEGLIALEDLANPGTVYEWANVGSNAQSGL